MSITVTTFVSSGLNGPLGLAFDSSGNLYCSNINNNIISIFSSTGTLIQTISSSELYGPTGLAFDSSGYLYCANSIAKPNSNGSTISKIDTTVTSVTPFASGLSIPIGLVFDSSGYLYCANSSNLSTSTNINSNTISKIDSTGTIVTPPFVTSITGPIGLAFDSSGYLYCSSTSGSTIYKIDITVPSVTPFITGLSGVFGLAFDKYGYLYCTNSNTGDILKIDTTNLIVTTFVSGLISPAFLVFDSLGNLYCSSPNSGLIYKVTMQTNFLSNGVDLYNLFVPLSTHQPGSTTSFNYYDTSSASYKDLNTLFAPQTPPSTINYITTNFFSGTYDLGQIFQNVYVVTGTYTTTSNPSYNTILTFSPGSATITFYFIGTIYCTATGAGGKGGNGSNNETFILTGFGGGGGGGGGTSITTITTSINQMFNINVSSSGGTSSYLQNASTLSYILEGFNGHNGTNATSITEGAGGIGGSGTTYLGINGTPGSGQSGGLGGTGGDDNGYGNGGNGGTGGGASGSSPPTNGSPGGNGVVILSFNL